MLKIAAVALLGLFLTGCASVAQRPSVLASAKPAELSSELECMVECLDDSGETCESCADKCLRTDDGPVVALGR